jgi:hypothetical protein
MKKVLISAAAALALTVVSAGSAFAGQVYGNYGPGYGPPPSYGPGPGYGPSYAGPPPGYYGRGDRGHRRHCGGDRAAGTIIGGILGGIIGNNIAGGRHRGPETVAGVIVGGIAGNAIARGSCRGDRYDRYDDRRGYGPRDAYRGGAYGGDDRYDPRDDDRYEPGYDDGGYEPGYDGGYDDDMPYEDRPYDGR